MKNADRILLMEPIVPLVEPLLEQRFAVRRYWQGGADEAAGALAGIRGIATGRKARVDRDLMDRMPGLEIVARFGAGYDSIDVAEAARRRIVVTNTPGVLSDEVADLAMGLLIASARRLVEAERFLREGRWSKAATFPLSPTLRGRHAGIFGLGSIGRAIAARCRAFGMQVSYHGRRRQPDAPYPYYERLIDMAAAVDVLMVAAPGGSATFHAVDAPVLQALGPDGIVVNVGRGSIVDEAALVQALRERRILGAVLDVFEKEPAFPPELLDRECVVLTPHVGSCSTHTHDAMGRLMVDNLYAYFDGRGPLNPVPETPWPFAPASGEMEKARP